MLNAYLFWCLNRFHRSGKIKQIFRVVNLEVMAEHACEDRYASVDLFCALCDNVGEIVRCVCTLPIFYLLSIICFLPRREIYLECSMTP
jgi:hypothetical protein